MLVATRPHSSIRSVLCARRLGSPVVDAFEAQNVQKLPYGMHDILGNAVHWDHSPTLEELSAGLEQLTGRSCLPSKVIRGAFDRGQRAPRDEQGPRSGAEIVTWLAGQFAEPS
jgi:hypothetical protein